MHDWTDGYVSDVEYLPGYYMEQAPAHLDLACLLRGIEPPRAPGADFRYCELGCGVGETALTIAAANPRAEVWAFDFNPAHIARGSGLARAAGLTNVHIKEASFEDLAGGRHGDLCRFDYIALHGVWAWVSAANRAYIMQFIERHLKPGGLVYVTYNALPGWTSTMPLQRLVSMFAEAPSERSDRRIIAALDKVAAFAKAGSGMIEAEMLERLGKERENGNVAYLSHEYLNAHWSPCYQVDVARDMAAAKLSYGGTANLLENFPDLSLTQQQRELVAATPAAFAETAKDYFMARTFRRDVYIRGVRAIADRRLDARIRDLNLALVIPEDAITRDIKVPLGEATLNQNFYGPALKALAEAPRTVGELMDLPEAERSSVTPREVVGMLVGSRQAMILANEISPESRSAAARFNAASLSACADESRAVCALAASGTGSGVTIRLFEMLAYEAMANGAPAEAGALTNEVWRILSARGDRIRHEGELIHDDDENKRLIAEQMQLVLKTAVPIWKRVGAI
ncbi:class I SAM-dependent methyltransferase [Mesorhizobium sp. 1B3]|uniref:class I SAM-dependent methyltransferase n=1 Tax=Mesorhizobium sp. 1B3 TaxID=3243599 RepID=UPI003D991886